MVFSKFKACLTVEGVNDYRREYEAVNIVYKSLQEDREKADISDMQFVLPYRISYGVMKPACRSTPMTKKM